MLLQFAEVIGSQTGKSWSFLRAWLVLTALMVPATIVVGLLSARPAADLDSVPLGAVGAGQWSAGWISCLVAGVVCWVAGSIALFLVALGREPMQKASLALVGMLVRMGLPMASVVLVRERKDEWFKAGYGGQLTVLFLVMLVVEIYCSLKVAAAINQPSNKSLLQN